MSKKFIEYLKSEVMAASIKELAEKTNIPADALYAVNQGRLGVSWKLLGQASYATNKTVRELKERI